jgi:hypothetical protein
VGVLAALFLVKNEIPSAEEAQSAPGFA